jgi:hypothetical protein
MALIVCRCSERWSFQQLRRGVMTMGNRANLVIVEQGDWSLHYSHWGGGRMLDALAFGPDFALRYIKAHRLCGQGEWTSPLWADGGALVDVDQRRLLFFGDELMTTMPERRAMLEVLTLTWPDYSVGWAYGGTDEIAAYVGAERRWEIGRSGQQLRLARGRDGLCQIVSVVGSDGALRLWPLWWGYSAAWQGPSLLNRLPGKGISRTRREMIPESGLHVDVPKRRVGAWVTTEARGLCDLLQDRWLGWQADFWEDRYEEQFRRCAGALRVPELDVAAGTTAAQDWLRRRVFQSFEDSPAGAIAGLMKLFDPSGPALEAGMNDVITSPFQPDHASWNRFEAACGQLRDVYTRSA